MNKQVVIAGLLGAIAAAEGDDPTPCEDINTKAAAEELATAEAALEAWEGKIEALEEAAEADAELYDSAEEAYADVTAAVETFYAAMEDARSDWQAEVEVKSTAEGVLDAIANGEVNTISGASMLLGAQAPTVAAAADAVEDAQDAYNAKYAEINDADFEDAEEETETGFRAALTAQIRQESLMEDAQETASSAEATAVEAYEDQEALVNALLVIEGCAEVSYADLGLSAEEEEATEAGTEAAEDAELAQFEECCNTRLSTYLAGLGAGDVGYEAGDCSANTGFGMMQQRATYDSARAAAQSEYTGYCPNEGEASLPTVNLCEGESEYTAYKSAYAAVMKAKRLRDIVDSACTDSSAYDCSNGILTNGGTEWTSSGDTMWHELEDSAGDNAANQDTIWAYREGATVDVAAKVDTSSEEGAWTGKYEGLADKLVAWTLAEARYWAYEAAWELHAADKQTADDNEAAALVTRDQKYDLLDAADANVLRANKLVSMYTSDLADEIAAADLLQADVVAAEEAHAVQVYLADQAAAAALVQQNIVDAWSGVDGCTVGEEGCYSALANLETLYTNAESSFDDIQESLSCAGYTPSGGCTGFYRTARDEALMFAEMSEGALMMAEMAVEMYTAGINGIEANEEMGEMGEAGLVDNLADAIAACKGLGYDRAQAAKKKLLDLEAANEEAAAEVAEDYAAKSAFADTGETNTLCAYPPKGADGSQEPRPECLEGYCCGAAQKFLKDGTKLAIETCQEAEGVHTYDYYPPLPEGSPVEPTPETWRFQCISGAQKLAATAAAALAASYMMA